jgi:hypothetical protein
MTYTFKLSRRLARFRGLAAATILLSIAGCNSTDSLDPESSAPPSSGGEPSLATTSFSGGIPIGIFALPTTYFGSTYNGAKETIGPYDLKNELAAIKSRGGRIVLMMAGSESNYKDANGHFSLTLWKQRIDRFRGIDFSSYISDGTIIAHYLIDEPQDPSNWNGVTIPPSTVDAMGQYSKQLWPGMATVVRTVPRFFPSSPRYIDAAWAQYLSRFGDPAAYLSQNVADAQARGLALIVGLNLQDGGLNKGNMTPSQVQTWGSAMLSSSYPCAFISWTFDASYLGTSDMKNAMAVLRSKAENRSQRSCGGGAATAPGTTPTPTPSPSPTPTNALPFGLSLPPATEYTSQWTGAVYRADPADLVSRLALSRRSGIKLIASLARPAASKNADGTFNMTKWKAEVDQFRSLSLGQYVTDQSLYLHLLVDQPNCAACWGGKAIPWSTVEAMARAPDDRAGGPHGAGQGELPLELPRCRVGTVQHAAGGPADLREESGRGGTAGGSGAGGRAQPHGRRRLQYGVHDREPDQAVRHHPGQAVGGMCPRRLEVRRDVHDPERDPRRARFGGDGREETGSGVLLGELTSRVEQANEPRASARGSFVPGVHVAACDLDRAQDDTPAQVERPPGSLIPRTSSRNRGFDWSQAVC